MKSAQMTRLRLLEVFTTFVFISSVTACSPRPAVTDAGATAVLTPMGGIKDLMEYEIDPAADAIWDSVGTIGDATGVHERVPSSDKEWAELRGQAIVLAEAANLLQISGRKVTVSGQRIQGDGAPGTLTTEQAEQAIQAKRAVFLGFARALQQVAGELLVATEAKDTQAILEKGETLDELCESCHLQFWYPKTPPISKP